MAQSVKSLLYKHQEQSLGPQQHCKNLDTVTDMGSPGAGEADRVPWLPDQSDQLLTQVRMHYLSVAKLTLKWALGLKDLFFTLVVNVVAGEMAQWSRTRVALAEGPGSIPSIHVAAHKHPPL